MIEIHFKVGDTTIEAVDNGKVLLNGKPIKDTNDVEDVLNTLIKAVISMAQHLAG